MMGHRVSARVISLAWWQYILAIDAAFIVLTLIARYTPATTLGGKVLSSFNLGGEMNLASWWSAVGLLFAGMLAYEARVGKARSRNGWLVLAALLSALSLDEVASLHERVGFGGWAALLPFIAFGAVLLAYALGCLLLEQGTRKSALLIAVGFTAFALSAGQEAMEHRLEIPLWASGIRTAVEEVTELAGTFLCLAGVVSQRPSAAGRSLGAVIPDPVRWGRPGSVLLALLPAHLAASLYAASLLDLPNRGNPAAWYPAAAYCVAACVLFWRGMHAGPRAGSPALLLSAALFLASGATMYQYRGLLGGNAGGPEAVWNAIALGQPVALAMAHAGVFRRHRQPYTLALVAALLLWLAGSALERPEVQYAAAGVLACTISCLFLDAARATAPADEAVGPAAAAWLGRQGAGAQDRE